jgi:hypothetical protein
VKKVFWFFSSEKNAFLASPTAQVGSIRQRADGAIRVDNAMSLPPLQGSIAGRLYAAEVRNQGVLF